MTRSDPGDTDVWQTSTVGKLEIASLDMGRKRWVQKTGKCKQGLSIPSFNQESLRARELLEKKNRHLKATENCKTKG